MTASGDATETVTLKVAASPPPPTPRSWSRSPILAEQGIDLVITEYGDYYMVPNTAVDEGDEGRQLLPAYPLSGAVQRGKRHRSGERAGKIHYEPMGIYAGKTASSGGAADGATIAVPNDATNEAAPCSCWPPRA